MPFHRTDEYHDHQRDLRKADPRLTDRPHWRQEYAVLKLTGYLDGILGKDLLPESVELALRERVIEAQIAFNIPTKAERGDEPARVAADISDAELERM